MSAFIVDPITINRILSFISDHSWSRSGDISIGIPSELRDLEEEDIQILGNGFLLLNKRAVDHRYNETNLLVEHKYEYVKTNIFQALKSAQCLRYQCCEGEFDKKKSYNLLNKIIQWLESVIIDRLPEYQEAKWE